MLRLLFVALLLPVFAASPSRAQEAHLSAKDYFDAGAAKRAKGDV